mmetsp:Transcript_62143/g.122063  ORF Transcript_62143/g.122063 Transcript_62143/m.122063 type:complete len:104 (-) Transcript_62143:346-657(-)
MLASTKSSSGVPTTTISNVSNSTASVQRSSSSTSLPGQTDAEDHDRIAGGYTEEVAASIPVISAEVIGAAFVKYYYSWPSAPTLYVSSLPSGLHQTSSCLHSF